VKKTFPATSVANPGYLPSDRVAILRLPAVLSRVGKCRSGLYAEVAAGRFPRPVKLSERAVGWLEHEVTKWLLDRVAARDKGARS
jgi:prophage regulatory protein